MPEVIMPKMGDGMESGVLTAWKKRQGDEVEVGDVIAEIEADKGSVELEAEDAGVLHELVASEGDEVPVGQRIAYILGEDEEAPEDSGGGDERGSAGDEDEAGAEDAEDAEDADADEDGDEDATQPAADEDGDGARPSSERDGDVRASPIVRRLAREHDLDLAQLEGSGPDGRIVERDVRAALEDGGAAAAPGSGEEGEAEAGGEDGARAATATQEPALPAPTGAPGTELRELSRTQQAVGRRMQQSWQQAPHHFATVEVDVGELLALRGELNDELGDDGVKLSINDFVVKACAVALGEHPTLNALLTSEGLELHETVDLAMAVALEDGLITPIIRDAGRKSLSAISSEAKDLARRAQDGELAPEEYEGGTFTISNMGMYGVESFTAVINPPSVSIVAVGAVTRRPAFDEHDQVVPRSLMKLTISSDHRVVNGADHAQYLGEVKRLLERPKLLTV